jgi:hypothetical protein
MQHVDSKTGEEHEELWTALHGKMFPIAHRIMVHRPKTAAGLAIFARAASFVDADAFDLRHWDESYNSIRATIEAMCAFCDVKPLPAEV